MSKQKCNHENNIKRFVLYCAAILRNESYNIKKKLRITFDTEILVSDPINFVCQDCDQEDYELFMLSTECFSVEVNSAWLYEALCKMPEKLCSVLILDFWFGYKQKEVSKLLGVTTRTVYNLRESAFSTLRQLYEETEQSHRTDRRTNSQGH